MKFFLNFTILCSFCFSLCAQVVDDFSDGNFSVNPLWIGDDSLFQVNNEKLQSNGPSASSILQLATANSLIDSTEWNFLIELGFNPSSTNFARIYLVSDQSDLEGSLNGYYMQLGEAGTAPDSIDIFRQDGTVSIKVFTGSACLTGSTAAVRVKITRDFSGLWSVFADCSGGNNLNFEGTFIDNMHSSTQFFGYYCRYSTTSRFDQYFLDDVLIRNILADTSKPEVSVVNLISCDSVEVVFSEAIDALDAENTSFYSVDNGIGNPSTAVLVGASKVVLTFSNPLPNAQLNTLSIQSIKDISGNEMNPAAFQIICFVPDSGDVVIHEIMADFDPQVNLPLGEFIELKNNRSFPVNLDRWTFSDAASTIVLPNVSIPADSFIVIASNSIVDSFASRGFNNIIVAGVSSLPALNNGGDELTLRGPQNQVIDFVNYSSTWYSDALKSNGGWTLERRNAETSCGEGNNWGASIHPNGGTPGTNNSIAGTFIDTTAPSIIAVDVLDSVTILVFFSENPDSFSAANPNNYSIDNGIGNPTLVSFEDGKALLRLPVRLDSAITYTLNILNIKDCIGNQNNTSSFTFQIPAAANAFDILITEIFADPEPSFGLPIAEYIEIYNASNNAISLKDWQLSDNTSTATLESGIILPQQYLILSSVNSIAEFQNFGASLGVNNFPGLNNSGETLTLRNSSGNIIHAVTYSDAWYQDNFKKAGGFSLEMIDLTNPCSGIDNWIASNALIGGTPGTVNSVNGTNPDFNAPELNFALMKSDTQLTLVFNEPFTPSSVSSFSQFEISPNDISAIGFQLSNNLNELNISLSGPPLSGIIYTIKVNGISDCAQNIIGSNNEAQFGLAEFPDSADILINEVLFNPESGGSDFVELYNQSNKIIDLKSLIIALNDFANPSQVISFTRISDEGFLFLPKTYVALSENPDNILSVYFTPNPKNVLLVNNMPGYPDKEGVVLLADTFLNTIDRLAYEEKWHFALLDDKNGVSLERLNFERPTQDEDNWMSAASTVGFATPAFKNSQFADNQSVDKTIQIIPESFSPNGDGNKDVLNIFYRLKNPGWLANMKIYDSSGRKIKDLVSSELLAVEGVLTWNGINDDNELSRIGIYILWVELINPDGKVKHIKKSFVLAGKI